jgi:hypothetical protein
VLFVSLSEVEVRLGPALSLDFVLKMITFNFKKLLIRLNNHLGVQGQ